MGCCASSPDLDAREASDTATSILVPVPLPRTPEEWARAGVPALLRVHGWLRTRALENAPRLRGTQRLMVRMAYFLPPAPQPNGTHPTALDEEGEPMEEDDASLRAAAANLGNTAYGAPNLLRIPAFYRAAAWAAANTALLAAECDATFLLPLHAAACHTLAPALPLPHVATLLRVFRDAVPAPSSGFLDGPDLALLLGLERKASLLESAFFPLLFRSAARGPGEGAAGLALSAAQWVTAVDAVCSLTEQGLLRLSFYHFARVGLAWNGGAEEQGEGGEGSGSGSGSGSAPPPSPYIAVSSLTAFFSEFREAARDPTHPSRQLLDELRLRARACARAEAGGSGSPAWRAKEAAYAAFISSARRGLLPVLPVHSGGESGSLGVHINFTSGTLRSLKSPGRVRKGSSSRHVVVSPPPLPGRDPAQPHSPHARHIGSLAGGDWGEEADRRAAEAARRRVRAVRATWQGGSPASDLLALMAPIEAICTGPEDMLSWMDYLNAFRRSPGSFFDLIYYQRQLRKVCGESLAFAVPLLGRPFLCFVSTHASPSTVHTTHLHRKHWACPTGRRAA